MDTRAVDLFVLAGQSNMQGYMGDAARYPTHLQELDKEIPFYWCSPPYSSSQQKWTSLRPQPGRFSTGHFGPEITLARSLRNAGLNPAIFKFSSPNTSLCENWLLPQQGGLYDKFLRELKIATEALESRGISINYRMTVWIQGESDARTAQMARQYKSHLASLITHFRETVLNRRNGYFLLGVDAMHPYCQSNPEVVMAQKELARSFPETGYVPMSGLQKADSSHLTPEGIAAHGVRLFQACKIALNITD